MFGWPETCCKALTSSWTADKLKRGLVLDSTLQAYLSPDLLVTRYMTPNSPLPSCGPKV